MVLASLKEPDVEEDVEFVPFPTDSAHVKSN